MVDLKPDAIVLRKDGSDITIALITVKTVRLHQRREVNPMAKAMFDVAETCNDMSCAIGVLVCVGIGAAARGIDDLAHPAKVV